MADNSDKTFERIIQYFDGSHLEYIALDYAGRSLRLSREAPQARPVRDGSIKTDVVAPGVGFIALPDGRHRFPAAGDPVAQGETLFAVRTRRHVRRVTAPATGSLASVAVTEGSFVEYGEPLATISTERLTT